MLSSNNKNLAFVQLQEGTCLSLNKRPQGQPEYTFSTSVVSKIMPQEPRVLSNVRSSLTTMYDKLKVIMPQAEFFGFLSAQVLPQIEVQVGSHKVLEVLRTICNVLHIQFEVSFQTA